MENVFRDNGDDFYSVSLEESVDRYILLAVFNNKDAAENHAEFMRTGMAGNIHVLECTFDEEYKRIELVPNSHSYRKMMEVATEYYQLLEKSDSKSGEELEELKNKLDELLVPYSDDPAYYALLKMKRIVEGV